MFDGTPSLPPMKISDKKASAWCRLHLAAAREIEKPALEQVSERVGLGTNRGSNRILEHVANFVDGCTANQRKLTKRRQGPGCNDEPQGTNGHE
jgi:hypothetical protein